MAVFVLVHGGWDGGWSWRGVAQRLRAAGHDVYTPTMTGAGERIHLASPEIDLETQVLDVTNVLVYEDLHDVYLVGNSYGGMIISGTAERVPERIQHLIYLDGFLPQDGESAADIVGPDVMGYIEMAAAEFGDGWRVPHDPPDAERRTPMLLRPIKQPLAVNNPRAAAIEHTYVYHSAKTDEDFTKHVMAAMAKRAQAAGWQVFEMPWPHWPLLDSPQQVADFLVTLAR